MSLRETLRAERADAAVRAAGLERELASALEAAAEGTADELKSQVGGERIEVVVHDRAQIPAATDILTRHGIGAAGLDEHTRKLTVPATGGATTLVSVVRDLGEAGITIDDVALRRPTLDDVFLSLTGHASVEVAEDAA